MSNDNHRSASQLVIIDELRDLPFPERNQQKTEESWSGPGYHLAVLRESQDFWEDRSEETAGAAEREIEADHAALTALLTRRWGEPETIDLRPYLGYDSSWPDTAAPPEPLNFLCGVAGSIRVWRLPASGRWLALAVAQADTEWPIQLLIAIAKDSLLAS